MSWSPAARSSSRVAARLLLRNQPPQQRPLFIDPSSSNAPSTLQRTAWAHAATRAHRAAAWIAARPHSTIAQRTGSQRSFIADDKGKGKAVELTQDIGRLLRPSGRSIHQRVTEPQLLQSSRAISTSATARMAPTRARSMDSEAGPSRDGLAGLGTTHLSPDILLRCTIFDAAGLAKSSSGVFKKSKLCLDHGLEPRDLRKIDSRVPNLVPTILARKGGILVNILHIRAMVKADMVLLFDSYGSSDTQLHSAFVYNLQFNLRQTSSTLPYEFRALESILVSVLDALRIELDLIRSWASRILEGLDEDVDREKLRALLQVSRKLNSFLSRSRGVKGAVTEVLDDDEDMALMYLTDSKKGEARTEQSKMDELELLLESFDKQVEEVVAETEQIHNDMNNTQEVVELILDNNRNKLLALDLRTSIATLGISAGTLWAGLFGMNLTSHFEEDQYAFFLSSAFAILTAVVVSAFGLRQLQRLRRVGLQLREPFGMTKSVPRATKYGATPGCKKRRWWWPFGGARSRTPTPVAMPAYPLASSSGYSGAYGAGLGGNSIGQAGAANGGRLGSPFMRLDEKYQQALAQHMSDAEDDPRHPFPTTPSSPRASLASGMGDGAYDGRRGPLFAHGGSNGGPDGPTNDVGEQQGGGGGGGVGLSSKWEARKKRRE